MERIFRSTPNKVLTAHTEWLPGVRLKHSVATTCAVHIEDCEGWWFFGCHGSVAEHWRLKPEVSWVRLPVAASLFHFPLFLPRNICFQREARCSEQQTHSLSYSTDS